MSYSVLFLKPKDRLPEEQATVPACFADLNLDQVVDAVTVDKEEYDLKPFFYMPLHDVDAVLYRHEVMQDLENEAMVAVIAAFAEHMHTVRELLAHTKEDYHGRQKERWLLDAADQYVDAVSQLTRDLPVKLIQSRGLKALKKYLDTYTASKRFTLLCDQVKQLQKELAAIRYEVLIEGLRVEVRRYNKEPNYSTEIQNVFERFSQESPRQYEYGFRDHFDMNHVEGNILDLVAQVYSGTFTKLAAFCAEHALFQDTLITRFDREVQFYIAYLAYIAGLKKEKLSFCYPHVNDTSKAVSASATFDLALAAKLAKDGDKPITNDFYLKGKERIIVVSGPNQGGKTTFARTFGQLHYLASLGFMVPGSAAQLYLPDKILTHFEREEKMSSLRGKLEDDLERMHEILTAATPRSIILINEIFTSTTLHDAMLLSRKIASSIMKLDALCVWITFIDEVSRLGEQTVSMVSTVKPDRPAVRTFKVVRQPADGLAYAISIAEKHHLTRAMINQRIKR